jgi:hypothetical protein
MEWTRELIAEKTEDHVSGSICSREVWIKCKSRVSVEARWVSSCAAPRWRCLMMSLQLVPESKLAHQERSLKVSFRILTLLDIWATMWEHLNYNLKDSRGFSHAVMPWERVVRNFLTHRMWFGTIPLNVWWLSFYRRNWRILYSHSLMSVLIYGIS